MLSLVCSEIKMKRLESPPSGRFMIVARGLTVPVAPLTIRRHIVSETKPSAFIGNFIHPMR